MNAGFLDEEGILRGAEQVSSPNCDERPEDAEIALLVVHSISLPPGEFGGEAIRRLFTNTLDFSAHPYYANLRELKVSAHFLVRRGGELVQFVPCSRRAWHAGASSWGGRERCNDFSVGVELEGTDEGNYADAQYVSLSRLLHALRRRYPIVDVVGHSDIAPGRKTDPGPAFDWGRLRGSLQFFA
ncbi:MAG TPA: 1,6-anhydro-N-acetylmuramyl-L-alanine amidase AmpD [Burkholderiales bacterium]|nr:1,6-anhydro-N-acetylmuramyl-L-alanine amidase AmpD [Burkholderiales bacterium]HYA47389.1 1,6-anhydro-N-acetylmuramyl-L-alanine amidase AmpD [Burkholderiales bacterium]